MSTFLQFTVFGLVLAAIYAVAASGLVVTYTTTGIFNFAHGAIGMIGAFAYWQFAESWGLNTVLSIALVLLVVAPLMGVVIDRVIMRGLEGTSEVTRVVVSIGLLFALLGLAPIIWNPQRSYSVKPFFGSNTVTIFDVGVSWHQLTAIVIAGVVALGLRWFLYGSRVGVTMRAVVDNRPLARLNGARPALASSLSWALGCSLAALAGILIAERVALEPVALTFLVVNAYAAAVVGRLTNLPLTFLGAIILGLAQSYAQGYLTTNPTWLPEGVDLVTPLRLAMPVLLLFVTLLALPNAPLRVQGLLRSRESVARPTIRKALIGGALLVVAVSVVANVLSDADVIGWSKGLGLALIMLSLVPLTGYGGQISLAQMSFAGLGAYAMAQWGADGSPLGLVAAVLLAGAVGALVALPALRLRGIYLGLATLAFAYFMDKVVFNQSALFPAGSRSVDRPSLGGLSLESDRAYMVFLAVAFALVGLGVVLLRLGPFGRRLQAMKDSPAACATLGMNLTVTKLQVFVLSAAIAGLGGALLSGVSQTAQVDEYSAIASLPIVLMAVAGGIAMVSGALTGGLILAGFALLPGYLPDWQVLGTDLPDLAAKLMLLAPGLIGISLGRNPNGAVNEVSGQLSRLVERWRARERGEPSEATLGDLAGLGIDRAFTAADLAVIDQELCLDEDVAAHYRPGAAGPWSGDGSLEPKGVRAGAAAAG